MKLTRRQFLEIGSALASLIGLPRAEGKILAEGVERLAHGRIRVLWLQGLACSGCSVSLLNAENPPILQVLLAQVALAFHPTLSAAQGHLAIEVIEQVGQGFEPFVLVVEGAVPLGQPEACRWAGRPLAEALSGLAAHAKFVVAAGTCASYGGIPSAEGNPTGAAGVREYFEKAGLPSQGRLVHCPGCPCHPDDLLTVLAHLAAKGYPEVRPATLTPTFFAASSLHDECLRAPAFTMRLFAMHFGDGEGCLYQLGCRGHDVTGDCARRRWNGGVNWCIQASAPCIGCNRPEFAKSRGAGFYNLGGPMR
jgi:hydrogenase small subunit